MFIHCGFFIVLDFVFNKYRILLFRIKIEYSLKEVFEILKAFWFI